MTALENWGRHFTWCAHKPTLSGELPPPCNCGYDEQLAKGRAFVDAEREGSQEIGAGWTARDPSTASASPSTDREPVAWCVTFDGDAANFAQTQGGAAKIMTELNETYPQHAVRRKVWPLYFSRETADDRP